MEDLPTEPHVTQLLAEAQGGNPQALNRLFELVYQELRQLAGRQMARERGGHTLQTTALVHEACLRLMGDRSLEGKNRAYFFKAAAEAMRRVLIERARRYSRVKRGGSLDRVDVALEQLSDSSRWRIEDLLSLNEALDRFEHKHERNSLVVKLHYFVGLSLEAIAQLLDVSTATVYRDWNYAKAWLYKEMSGVDPGGRIDGKC